MKIGIDIRALTKNSAGIGYYIKGFLWGLSQLKDDDHQYFLYANAETNCLFLPKDQFTVKIFKTNELSWYYQIWQDMKKEKIEFFYSTHSTLFSFLPGIKTALAVHDLSAILFPELHTWKVRILAGEKMLHLACKKAQFIVVPSQSTKNDLEKIISENKEKIQIIPNGYFSMQSDSNKFPKNEKNRFSDWHFRFILYLGTIEPRKNLVRLIEAFANLKIKEKIPEKLVIAGKKGWFTDQVFAKIEELKIENAVILTEYVRDIEKQTLMQKASVFVYPSLYEGFGFPILEAMVAGVPVLTSNISSLPEITGKDYPYLVDPLNSQDIEEKLFQILNLGKKERQKLIVKNRERTKKFSWLENARLWVKLLKEVK